MSAWYVIKHVEYEGAGLIAIEADARGIELRTCNTYSGDQLPSPEQIDGLVVMGGPMSVNDTDSRPHLADERKLIAAVVERGLPVLGICLGAQLLASALGAEISTGEQPEIGTGSVSLTADGGADPILGPCGPNLPVFHWHQDTFSLPRGAKHLAQSGLYANQAFRIDPCAYGLQFHVEVDAALAGQYAPHLPRGVEIEGQRRLEIERAGRGVIARFFDLAAQVQRT